MKRCFDEIFGDEDLLRTNALPSPHCLGSPCLLHDDDEDVTKRHALNPSSLVLAPETMAVCEQRGPPQQYGGP